MVSPPSLLGKALDILLPERLLVAVLAWLADRMSLLIGLFLFGVQEIDTNTLLDLLFGGYTSGEWIASLEVFFKVVSCLHYKHLF